MLLLLRIVILIALLIVLLRLKLNLALAIIVDAICAGILFRLRLSEILYVFPNTLAQLQTLEFLFIIYMVLLLAVLLKETGNLTHLICSLDHVFKDPRIGIAVMPALIGLLPMPAGAMLSAPIVREVGVRGKFTAAHLTHINYWFRHVWEYFWPLYPGILLSAGIFNVTVRDIMITQYPLTILALVAGIFFILGLPRINTNAGKARPIHIVRIIYYMWPIFLVIILVMIARFRMSWALGISGSFALILSRTSIKEILQMFKKAFFLPTLGVIYAVFLFKNIMHITGALTAIPSIAQDLSILQMTIIFIAPFMVGLLTGLNSAFVGMTFPVIAPLIPSGSIQLQYIMFAYASGFAGVMLSPVHLCLCLTKEYYGASFSKIYSYLLPSLLFVFFGAIVLLFLSMR